MPASRASTVTPAKFATFGDLLRFLRHRAGLTQRELSIAVGYSESQISRLEQNQRAPDDAALAARFVPALGLETEPGWAARLVELGQASRAEAQPDAPETPPSPHNLPVQLTSFIGRERELAEVTRLLTPLPGLAATPPLSPGSQAQESGEGQGWGVRLLTLTGHGGCGKTRLALQSAAALLPAFPDGVWWVELAPLADPALLPQSVAAILGLKEEPDRPLLTTLTRHLGGKSALLILDNCEHLIAASAAFADAVLHACPELRILATSREMLGVPGERALVVHSLASPDPGAALNVDDMGQYDAVRLFVERSQAVLPDFAVRPDNAAAVAQVCRRLDGIPLALELAAARLRMLPVEQIAARLDDAFRLLTGGSRTALPRHRTLEASIDWSYDLLTAAEQAVLQRLAVCAGGWSLEAAEAVCTGESVAAGEVLDLLARLVDKSMVLVERDSGAARYRLLETIRQYALAKLAESGEADAVRRRHAEFFLAIAEAEYNIAWLNQMHREHDNLRAALAWSQATAQGAELGLRLAISSYGFWYYHGHWSEARGWLEGVLAHPQAANFPREQVLATLWLGRNAANQGDYESGQAHLARGLQSIRDLGDRAVSAFALERFGWLARERGDAATARARLEEAVALFRELGDQEGIGGTTNTLAETMIMQGELATAKGLLEDSLALSRRIGNLNNAGWALNHLGHIAQIQGEYLEALRLHEESLQLFDVFGGRSEGTLWAHQSLGETRLAQGDTRQAAEHFREALALSQDLISLYAMAWCLAGFAGVAALDEEPERAARLWGAAEALRQSIGAREAPAARATHERLQAAVREQLGEAAFAAAWAEGEALSWEAAAALALQAAA